MERIHGELQKLFEKHLRAKHIVPCPHTPGARSADFAARIAALMPEQRTLLQERLLHLHEQGECIGCNYQGFPTDVLGNELALRYESKGFAAPREYCDCPKGQRYRAQVERQRVAYDKERIQQHLRYMRHLFGSSCVLPKVTASWTLASWPVELAETEGWEEAERALFVTIRQSIKQSIHYYAEHLEVWDETLYKQGIGLFGSTGVGKSSLLRCLEPSVLAHDLAMVSLYVPDLLVVLESGQMEQMIAAILATDVVLFDNLGFLVSLGYKEMQGRLALIRLINARWERGKRTLFTSNVTEEQLSEQLGEDTMSRLSALCRFFEVPGVDMRRAGRQ